MRCDFYDTLFDWCSERQQGSMDSFREAHDWLGRVHGTDTVGKADLTAYNLQALGHLEVSWLEGGTWAVTPPTVTMLENSGGLGLLVGARPRWLMRRLQNLEVDADTLLQELSMRVMMELRPQPKDDGPTTLYLTARDDLDLEGLSERLGIAFERRVSQRLREVLPVIDSYLEMGWKASPPPGFEPRRFELYSHDRWSEVADESRPGAYEYRRYGPPRYLFYDGEVWAEADKWIVVYAELRRRGQNILYYRTADRSMFVPARAPLPLLYARAAALCTGRLPTFTTDLVLGIPSGLGALLQYPNVQPSLFKTIASRLGQALQTTRE